MPEKTAKVRVIAPYRVVHEGNPYTGGDELTVPEGVAVEWTRSRYVERVTATAKEK